MKMSRALTTDSYNEDYIEIEEWPVNCFGWKVLSFQNIVMLVEYDKYLGSPQFKMIILQP